MADESRVTYTAGAAQTHFAITFPYQLESHLFVNVDGVDTAFTVSGSDVVIAGATVGGEEVEVYRDTQRASGPVVDYTGGSSVTESNLDDQANQTVYLAQEIWDRLKTKMGTASVLQLQWDAESQRITNVLDPTGSQDATTKTYVDAINTALSARLDALEAGGSSSAFPSASPSDVYDIVEVDANGDWVKADTVRSSSSFPNTVVRTGGNGLISNTLLPSIASGVNDAANVGAGVGLYRDILSQVINLRSLVSNTVNAVTITLDGNEVDFAIVFSDGAAGAADKLWSSQKVETELATKSDTSHGHAAIDLTDTPASLTADTVWVVNAGGTALEAVDFLDIDVPAAANDRKGRIVYWDASGNGSTLPPGRPRQSLTMNDAATRLPVWQDEASAIPVRGPAVQRLVVATDWQGNESYPGWEIAQSEADQTLIFQRCATAYIPPGALMNGGSVDVRMRGEFTPGSSRPGIAVQAILGGTLLRPAGTLGSEGWKMNFETMGYCAIGRWPASSRWGLDLRITSLGVNAQASGSHGGGNATVLTEGKLYVHDLVDATGFACLPFGPIGTLPNIDLKLWRQVAFTAGDRVWHPSNPGYIWTALVNHTGVAHWTGSGVSNEPGVSAYWMQFWRPSKVEYQIHGTHDISTLGTFTNDQGLELHLDVSGPVYDDTTDPAAYSATATYNPGDRVLQGGVRYMNIWGYVGTGGGTPTNGERYEPGNITYPEWAERWYSIDTGYDTLHVDSIEVWLNSGLAGYEPVL